MKPHHRTRTIIFCLLFAGCTFIPPAFADETYIDESVLFDDGELNESAPPIADPFKRFNKAMFNFNDSVYVKVLTPVSRTYGNAMPGPAQKGLKNFFSNLGYPVRLTGSLLQFKFRRAGRETGRFLLNSTIGLAGFMNPAKDVQGLNPPKEDVGQAFGRWGIGHGFYLVLPLLGPTSLRDGIGGFGDRIVDPVSTPWSQIDDNEHRLGLQALKGLNASPAVMDAYGSMLESAIDPYEAVKDLYTQRRAVQVSE